MNGLPRNIEARPTGDGRAVFYIRATIARKRVFQSTGLEATPANVEAARRIRDAVLRAAHERRFDVLEESHRRRQAPYATLGKVFDRYLEICGIRRDIAQVSARLNVQAMTRLVGRALEKYEAAVREVSTSVLTDELVERWARVAVPAELAGEAAESAQRTCMAVLRHARSIFKRDIVRQYRGLKLPDVRPFMEAFACQAPRVRYELPAADVYTRIIEQARTTLAATRPDLYAAFVLCFDLALRVEEAAAARWSWIEHVDAAAGRQWIMRVIARPDEGWRPKGVDGAVPVAPGVLRALEAAAGRRDGDPYILPGGSPTARRELAMQGLADWMRGLGWSRRKCAHELRKLKGSFWRARSGLDRAFEWLRHANVQTTVDYYARIPLRDEPHRIDG